MYLMAAIPAFVCSEPISLTSPVDYGGICNNQTINITSIPSVCVGHRRMQDRFPSWCYKVSDQSGCPGALACKGAEPVCVGKFGISELNLCDLVHTFKQPLIILKIY